MKNLLLSLVRFTGFLGFVLIPNIISGQVMLSPVSVTTAIPSFNDTVSGTNMYNQSGITTPFVSGVTVFDTYFANPGQTFATSGNGGTNNWQSDTVFDSGYQGFIDFDLGAVYQINKIAIWNRSISNLTVKVLNELAGPEQIGGNFTIFDRQSFTFSYAADVLAFTNICTGRFVRLDINGIYLFQGFSFGNVSAGEVVVSAVSVGTPPPVVGLSLDPNGDVRLTFTGTLQTSAAISGTFTNVPGNPSSPYTIPKGSLSTQQYFRSKN